jgi:branched-chain amino acid transport system ATP-binding protein
VNAPLVDGPPLDRPPRDGPLLEVRGLTAGYGGAPVLHGIDLTVEAGTITAVLGANGAGKTTLLRALSGLIRRSAGDIRYDGDDISAAPVESLVQRGIAHVPEGGGVIAELTVEDNLRLGSLWRRDRGSLDEVYALFPALAERRRYAGHQLSGGERQMLGLGRALAARPRLLLLDEPSLGLAPRVVAQLMALLRDLRDTTGVAALLVEQNVRSALSIAERGVVMALGRVVAAGDADRMRDDHDLRHAYLGF